MSNTDRNYDHLFKVLLCGDSGVGKTCLISQFTDNQVRRSHITTIGIDFKLKTFTVQGKRIRLQIWREALALQEHCAQTCSAHYRAPELFEVSSSCTITAKTDIWSLGCSIYAAAFGQSPCDGSALSAMSGRIVFPKEHSYSEEFCHLIMWILSVDPNSRPTVEGVEERLASLLEQIDQDDS